MRKAITPRGLLAMALAPVFLFGPSRSARAQQQSAAATLPRIIVLATGGTIAGQAARNAIGYDAGKVTGAALVAAVPGLDHLATLSAEQI